MASTQERQSKDHGSTYSSKAYSTIDIKSKPLTPPNELKECGMGIIDICGRRLSPRFVEDSTREDQDSNTVSKSVGRSK